MSQRHDHRGGGNDRYNDNRNSSGPYGSGGPRRRGQPNRRSYEGVNNGGGSQGPQQNYDPAGNMKHKIVKLGDQPERLLAKMRETGSLIDSFLTHDFRTYLNSIFNEVPSAGVDAAGLGAYFKQQALLAFDSSHSRLPSAAIILKLFVDCITKLPHKHSYYVCLLWYMLHETLGGNPTTGVKADADEEVKSVRADFADIFYKFATVRVKGEPAVDEVEVVALVDRPGGVSIPVKFEVGDQRHLEFQDRALFIMIIIARVQDLLFHRIKEIFATKNGYESLSEVYGAFRGLADFVNVGLLDATNYIELCKELIIPCDEPAQRICLTTLAATSLMWLSASVYQQHLETMNSVLAEILRLLRASRSESSLSVRALSASRSYSLETPEVLDPQTPVCTTVDFLIEALESLKARSWVPKSLPRLYDSAKLKEFQRRECDVPMKLPLQQNEALSNAEEPVASFGLQLNWAEFSGHQLRLRYPPRFQCEDASTPVLLWRAPKCELTWRLESSTHEYLDALDDAYQSRQLEVELMKPCDIYILKIYIEQTVHMFYQDLDLCAETLLLIPCKHDQFTLVLLNHLFEIVFSPTPTLQGLSLVNVMDGIFLCQLVRRLCILERSLQPHVLYAVHKLLSAASTLSEFTACVLVDFLSTWITSHDDDQVNELCNVFLSFPELENCPTIADLAAPVDSAYKKPGAGAAAGVSALLRVITLVISRVSRLSSSRSFKRKIPAYLRRLAPEHDILNLFNPYRDVAFCRVDNDDATRCRIPADLEEMKKLNFDSRAPLEATILRDLLRLQMVGGRREQVVLINECVALLRDLVGTTPIQSLREFTRLEQDELLFGANRGRLGGAGGSLKVEGPIVKSEMSDGAELEVVSPSGAEMNSNSEIVAELDHKSAILRQPFPRFADAVDWKWTVRRVSRLFSLVLHTIGARTLSHLQKGLEHYTPVVKGWKMFLSRSREEDEERMEDDDQQGGSEVLAFESMLIEDAIDLLWKRTNNITRVWQTLAHLVNRDCVSLHTLIGYLIKTDLLTNTIGGDFVFWEVVDLCVNNISSMPSYLSEDITRNVMRDYRQSGSSVQPVRKVEEDASASEGVKAELPPAPVPAAVSAVARKMEEEPNVKLSQDDLYQLFESIIVSYLRKPNALLHPRLLRLLRIAHVHLNRALFGQLAEKISASTEDAIVRQQLELFAAA